MPSTVNFANLRTEEWRRLQDAAEHLEQAWEATQEPVDLLPYLPPPDAGPLRAAYLEELVKTDLEMRWRHGQAVGLEYYVEKYPELGAASGLRPALILEEYRVRHALGDRPSLSVYERRFPKQYKELEKLLEEQPLPAQPMTFIPKGTVGNGTAGDSRVGESGLLPVGSGYKLIKKIGQGSYGEVWSAESPGGFRVAVKIINRPLTHRSAQREVQALDLIKQLAGHPFLLQTHAYWSLKDRLFIVMELADGSLCDRFDECLRGNPEGIPLPELLGYFREVAEALDFLHSRQVLHRDIKPANILLSGGHAKLADFGLARLHVNWQTFSHFAGTPAYMPPETWQRKAGPESDQYELAVTYAELRLCRRLFDAESLDELKRSHQEGLVKLDPLPPAEQEVLRKALAKTPADRYPSCLDFVAALEKAVADDAGAGSFRTWREHTSHNGSSKASRTESKTLGRGSGTRDAGPPAPPPPAPTVSPTVRRRRDERILYATAAALALAALALLAVWYFGPAPRLTLVQPADLTVGTGTTKEFLLQVDRDLQESVSLAFHDLPPGIRIGPASFRGASVTCTIQVAKNAPVGSTLVQVSVQPLQGPPDWKGFRLNVVESGPASVE